MAGEFFVKTPRARHAPRSTAVMPLLQISTLIRASFSYSHPKVSRAEMFSTCRFPVGEANQSASYSNHGPLQEVRGDTKRTNKRKEGQLEAEEKSKKHKPPTKTLTGKKLVANQTNQLLLPSQIISLFAPPSNCPITLFAYASLGMPTSCECFVRRR